MTRPISTVVKELLLPEEGEDLSEGEEIIRDFLEDEGFTFKREVELDRLFNDSKKYRRADFYLPKYGLYIEFLGGWNNNKEERERYREKMRVYWRNGVPCLYLFPENLGTLEHSFRRRASEVLQRYGMKRELFRFNFKCWWGDFQIELLLLAALVYSFFAVEDRFDQLVIGIILLWPLIYLWRMWRMYFAPVKPRAWVKRASK
jgi:hypothetical protein